MCNKNVSRRCITLPIKLSAVCISTQCTPRSVYKIPYRRAPRLAYSAFRPSASREQRYLAYNSPNCIVCKIPLLARALGLKADARPSARVTIGYLVYNKLRALVQMLSNFINLDEEVHIMYSPNCAHCCKFCQTS